MISVAEDFLHVHAHVCGWWLHKGGGGDL